jgi:hypothetical protein
MKNPWKIPGLGPWDSPFLDWKNPINFWRLEDNPWIDQATFLNTAQLNQFLVTSGISLPMNSAKSILGCWAVIEDLQNRIQRRSTKNLGRKLKINSQKSTEFNKCLVNTSTNHEDHDSNERFQLEFTQVPSRDI